MSKPPAAAPKPEEKRSKISQTDFPAYSVDQALRIAGGLWDDFAGKEAEPHHLAISLNMSPTSGPWRMLCGSAIAYGLTTGGYGASTIQLTELGRRIVSPLEDGEDLAAIQEACLKPRIVSEFFRKYDKGKMPKDEIAKNVLISLGIPKERADQALDMIKRNGDRCGFILTTKTGPFVSLSGAGAVAPRRDVETEPLDDYEADVVDENHVPASEPTEHHKTPERTASKPLSNRVFITHGKDKKILEQVKELVSYGKFEPIVAQERETAAKPVPEKVMDEMRSCLAAVIHVGIEEVLFDKDGKEHRQINGNVLIEIGAAMALYGRKFILLVEEGITLPSNLQGLYECRYSGDELSMTSTMKLLKAFNEFN